MLTAEQVARKLWAAVWGSRNRPPNDSDKSYWTTDFWNALDKHGTEEMNPPHPDYAYDRALGWQATGDDVPPFGPFAQPPTPLRPVPPYPGDTQPSPTPTPTPEPAPPTDTDDGGLDGRLARMEAILAFISTQGAERLIALEGKVDRLLQQPQVGSVSVPYLGSGKITLQPIDAKK